VTIFTPIPPSGCHAGINRQAARTIERPKIVSERAPDSPPGDTKAAAQRLHEAADAGEPVNGVEVDLLHSWKMLSDHVRFAK